MAPILTRNEKLVMRISERKDIFSEKFLEYRPASSRSNQRAAESMDSVGSSGGSGGGGSGAGPVGTVVAVDIPRTRTDSLSSQVSEPESSDRKSVV